LDESESVIVFIYVTLVVKINYLQQSKNIKLTITSRWIWFWRHWCQTRRWRQQ